MLAQRPAVLLPCPLPAALPLQPLAGVVGERLPGRLDALPPAAAQPEFGAFGLGLAEAAVHDRPAAVAARVEIGDLVRRADPAAAAGPVVDAGVAGDRPPPRPRVSLRLHRSYRLRCRPRGVPAPPGHLQVTGWWTTIAPPRRHIQSARRLPEPSGRVRPGGRGGPGRRASCGRGSPWRRSACRAGRARSAGTRAPPRSRARARPAAAPAWPLQRAQRPPRRGSA